MKRVLITGATGFIGGHCIGHLSKSNFDIHAVHNSNPVPNKYRVNWHKVDLLNHKDVERLISTIKPTHILHLAWYAVHNKYWMSEINHQWVKATLCLLNIAEKYNVQRTIGAGSCAEYDWSYNTFEENVTPVNPLSVYGQCKAATGNMFKAYSRNEKMSTAWGRIFFLYGPHEKSQKLIASIFKKLLNKELAVCHHSQQQRDYLYVDDVASALVSLLESDVQGPVNIGSGITISLGHISNLITVILGEEYPVKLETNEMPNNIPEIIKASTQRLNNEVGWKPNYSLRKGLEATAEWWNSNSY